jgi:Gluconate 2-dehydrogenase subunit 3
MNRRIAISSVLLGGGAAIALSRIASSRWSVSLPRAALGPLEDQRDLLASLAETVIPATDTPGATDAKVVDVLIVLLRDCCPSETQKSFTSGLQELQRYCQTHYNTAFQACTSEQRTSALVHFEPGRIMRKLTRRLGPPFFDTLRRLVTIAYCTSQVGATQGLAYDLVPGVYVSCIAMRPQQKAWAL